MSADPSAPSGQQHLPAPKRWRLDHASFLLKAKLNITPFTCLNNSQPAAYFTNQSNRLLPAKAFLASMPCVAHAPCRFAAGMSAAAMMRAAGRSSCGWCHLTQSLCHKGCRTCLARLAPRPKTGHGPLVAYAPPDPATAHPPARSSSLRGAAAHKACSPCQLHSMRCSHASALAPPCRVLRYRPGSDPAPVSTPVNPSPQDRVSVVGPNSDSQHW